MSDRARMLELLEEVLESGRTPEEVCAADQDLLDEVRERWQRCRALGIEIDALFPSSCADKSRPGIGRDLPAIPGYEVTALLGRGGMGVVYRARHLKLDRPVAIKMMLSGGYASEPELTRFAQEARTIAGLRHPHIIQVYDVGDLEGQPYYAMELIEGQSLAERLRGVPLPARDAAELVALIAEAVEVAHQAGIVHRDLKPANILLAADGAPKVADFGLARRLDGEAGFTLVGAKLGTPSYMAPEQAIGKADAVGPAADVYSLGAILYETLTGRPPFQAETVAETERQLLSEEPVRPSLLNARVPRDLETIGLRCLQKVPERRYASAAELADDLRRFLRGEPILARRVGRVERAIKWVKRHPAATIASGSGLAVALAVVAGTAWIVSERSATWQAVDEDLRKTTVAQENSLWAEASSAMDRAAMKLGNGGPSDLQRRLDRSRRDQDLVRQLKAAHDATQTEEGQHADRDYAQAFRAAGLWEPGLAPEIVAKRVRASNVRAAIVAALDDWAAFSDVHRDWLLKAARLADDDPTGWRDRVRDPAVWKNGEALARLAESAPLEDQPAAFLLSITRQLAALHRYYEPLLLRTQEAHPRDFWVNYKLGMVMAGQNKWEDSARFFQAAEAISPEASTVQNNLGFALIKAGRPEEGISRLRNCIRTEGISVLAQKNLAFALADLDRHAEALPELERSIELEPNSDSVHWYLGRSLAALGRLDDAVSSFERAIALAPEKSAIKRELRQLWINHGRHQEALAAWRECVSDPSSTPGDWDGYAEYCAFLGQQEEYRRARQELLDRFEKSADPRLCERTGRACLLMPGSAVDMARAARTVDLALAGEASLSANFHRYFMFAKGLAEYRAGHFESALSIVERDAAGVLGPSPLLVAAMARHRLGQESAARNTLSRAALSFNWSESGTKVSDAWIHHTLRREAEQLILPNFSQLLDGSSSPWDLDERLALLAACQFAGRQGRCAELWREAIAGMPKPQIELFDKAAKVLVTAASGAGSDAAEYADADRQQWRQTAVECLSTYLDMLEQRLKSTPTVGGAVQKILKDWREAPELEGIRDPEALVRLPAEEQEKCRAFWARVESVMERSQ